MNFLTKMLSETMCYAALWAKPLKRSLPAWLRVAILDLGLSKNSPHFCEGHPGSISYLTFIDYKFSEKRNLHSPQSQNCCR